jgi:hypothetical protein
VDGGGPDPPPGVEIEAMRMFRVREGVVVWLGDIPLRLAFRAREGVVVVRLGDSDISLRLTF